MNTKNNRIEWIDAAKGFLIILVVMYHYIQSFCPDLLFFVKLVSAFFMQSFFVLSGYLLNKSTPLKIFISKKIKSLFIPYCIYCLLLLLYNFLTSLLNNDTDSFLNQLKSLLIPTVLSCNNSFFNVLWFFPCLFCAIIFVRIVVQITEKKVIQFFFVTVYALSMYLLVNYYDMHLPMCLDTAGVASFWIYVGYLFKNTKINPLKIKKIGLSFLVIFFVILSVFVLKTNSEERVYDSFRNIGYVNTFITFMYSFTTSILIFNLGKLLQKIKILTSIGKKTDIIYGLHLLFLTVFYKAFSYLNIQTSVIYEIIQVVITTASVILIISIIYTIKNKLIFSLRKLKENQKIV